MKKCVLLFICLFAAGFLVMCLSMQAGSNIQNKPAFSYTEWKSKKIGIFPSFISNKANVTSVIIEEELNKSLIRNKYKVISAMSVKKMISEKKLADKYESAMKHYRMFQEIDDESVCDISEKIGLDYVLVPVGIIDYSFNDEDSTGYKAETKLFFYDLKKKSVVDVISYIGESARYKQKKKPNLIDALNMLVSDNNPTPVMAYKHSVHGLVDELRRLFVGECISGDCQNGTGVFVYYENRYDNKGDFSKNKYEGSWLDGLAHGKGTMYAWNNTEMCLARYDGEWALGKLKKKGPTLYLVNDIWVKEAPHTRMTGPNP